MQDSHLVLKPVIMRRRTTMETRVRVMLLTQMRSRRIKRLVLQKRRTKKRSRPLPPRLRTPKRKYSTA